MQRNIASRLMWLVVVLLGVSLFAFGIVYMLPGDPARVIAGERASEEVLELVRTTWGLDKPLHVQYLNYLKGLLRGDMGRSYYFGSEVFPTLAGRLPATGMLVFASLVISLLIGIPAGVISAVRQYGWIDRAVMIFSLLGIVLPAFLVGLLLIYVFGYSLELLPLRGYGGFRYLILPAVTLGIRGGGWYARVLRSTMLDILGEDYIRTARAKGLRERSVMGKHAVRNAWGPLVTMVAADIGYHLGGVLVVEKVFSWPGIGLHAWNAIDNRDVPMIMGVVLFGAFFVVLANVAADVLQILIDPRIRNR